MEKENIKIERQLFETLVSSKKPEKKVVVETNDEYEKRLFGKEKEKETNTTKKEDLAIIEWKNKILLEQQKENIACLKSKFSSPDMKTYKWFHGITPLIFVVFFFLMGGALSLWADMLSIVREWAKIILTTSQSMFLGFLSTFIVGVTVVSIVYIIGFTIIFGIIVNNKINSKLFKELCEKDFLKAGNEEYNVYLATYLYKKYTKIGDDEFNNFMLEKLSDDKSLKYKMYEYNHVLCKENWDESKELKYMKDLFNCYKGVKNERK